MSIYHNGRNSAKKTRPSFLGRFPLGELVFARFLSRLCARSGKADEALEIWTNFARVGEIRNFAAKLRSELGTSEKSPIEGVGLCEEIDRLNADDLRFEIQDFLISRSARDKDGRWLTPSIVAKAEELAAGPNSGDCGTLKAFDLRMARLAADFYLNRTDCQILEFFFCLAVMVPFKETMDELMAEDVVGLMRLLSLLTGCSPTAIADSMGENGRLYKSGLFDSPFAMNTGFSRHGLENSIASSTLVFMTGLSRGGLKDSVCENVKRERLLDADDFGWISPLSMEILERLLRRRGTSNLLLYGQAGTGKSTLASILARRVDRRLFRMKNIEFKSRTRNESEVAASRLRMAFMCMNPSKDVLLVDEADSILNTMDANSFLDKGRLNQLMESHGRKVIWITNRHRNMDPSTRRRFDYSLELFLPSRKEREKIWLKLASEHGAEKLIDKETVVRHFAGYGMSPANISLAVRAVALGARACADHDKALSVAREIVIQQHRLCEIKDDESCSMSGSGYDPALVNSDPSLSGILDACRHYLARQKNVAPGVGHSLSLLFQGPPGSGKTEFARHLASELDRPLIVKIAGDLLNCWLGGTEANIAKAFAEAERDGAVLFLDEADGLIRDRELADHSWEVTQVNELLVRMERFRGILVCATNHAACMDTASMRRFAIKIEFRPLSSAQAALAFQRLLLPFCKGENMPEDHAFAVLADHVCLGDYRVVATQAELGRLGPAPEDLIAALKKEAETRNGNKRIGF